MTAAANQAGNKDKSSTGKSSKSKGRKDSPKDLKKQIDDFKAEWLNLNDWQKNYFIKTYQDEIREKLEAIEVLAGMEEDATNDQPALS